MSQYVYTMHRVGKIVPPKKQILKDISLSFFPGAKIGILGLNGSGKTTILRIMAGVDTDIDGDAIPMPNLTIGYLEQEPKLDPAKTVREVVEEAHAELLAVRKRLDEVYAAYGEADADFDALAAEQAKLEAIVFASDGEDLDRQRRRRVLLQRPARERHGQRGDVRRFVQIARHQRSCQRVHEYDRNRVARLAIPRVTVPAHRSA